MKSIPPQEEIHMHFGQTAYDLGLNGPMTHFVTNVVARVSYSNDKFGLAFSIEMMCYSIFVYLCLPRLAGVDWSYYDVGLQNVVSLSDALKISNIDETERLEKYWMLCRKSDYRECGAIVRVIAEILLRHWDTFLANRSLLFPYENAGWADMYGTNLSGLSQL